MKRFFAMTLLAFHLFSIGGQLLLQQVAAFRAEKIFNERVAKGLYKLDDLTEVVIPVNMPNITEWPSYENVSGQIQFQNNSYNYVKMRLTRTAIYLQCIPNYQTTRLSDENIISANDVKNAPLPKKDHVPAGKMLLLNAFNQVMVHYHFVMPEKPIRAMLFAFESKIVESAIDAPGQPPQMV